MEIKRETQAGLVINEQQAGPIFNMLTATIERSKTPITAVFLSFYADSMISIDKEMIEEELTLYFNSKIRQTDILIKLSKPHQWCVILLQSKEEEANAFLKRLFHSIQNEQSTMFVSNQLALSASVIEIRSSSVEYEGFMRCGCESLENSIRLGDWQIEYVEDFKEIAVENIKVSILEQDEVFSRILSISLENLQLDRINLEIKSFQDGFEFLESDWHSSSHTHLVIMNDILPRKNGFEVLHTIRKWPNNKRFIIFMLTKRTAEEDMIFAFVKGVDAYLAKPFNIRLFEAQVKGTLERLWK
ncbi:response regulator transcription factor [Bacillus sp. J33]|uniref:response regulator transcription factor n=1 Tax=Bacillus sp. J33 TaxID=935836 RepID=UPI0004AEA426|nr:response regulator [Bacillus sp. J33]